MTTPTCYYCSRPEGAPHLPECPVRPDVYVGIDWADERLNASVRAYRDEAAQHAAKALGDRASFIIQDGVVYDFPKSRGTIRGFGGFVTAQANPTPPGALLPPSRDEVLAFERSKLPVEEWDEFDQGRLSPTWMACSCGGNSGSHATSCRKHGR